MGNGSIARRWAALAAVYFLAAHTVIAVQSGDPVQNAKSVVRQGELQLAQMRREVKAENYDEALRVLTAYRDAMKSAHAALKATGRDAEKKPNGFKNLQIHIRQSLQRLDRTILSVPVDQREPFAAIRKELDAIDRELIDVLFPRQPSRKPGETKPNR